MQTGKPENRKGFVLSRGFQRVAGVHHRRRQRRDVWHRMNINRGAAVMAHAQYRHSRINVGESRETGRKHTTQLYPSMLYLYSYQII